MTVRLTRVGLVVVKHRQGDRLPIELQVESGRSGVTRLSMTEAIALRDALTAALDHEEAHSEL